MKKQYTIELTDRQRERLRFFCYDIRNSADSVVADIILPVVLTEREKLNRENQLSSHNKSPFNQKDNVRYYKGERV